MESAIILKGGMATLITLHCQSNQLASIEVELEKKKRDAPSLFHNLPCAIDLQGYTPEQLDLGELLSICRNNGLRPIAVRNATAVWTLILDQLQLADLGRSRSEKSADLSHSPVNDPRIYQGNVRSGQQLYHDGDLTIFGMVSAGAEVLASGSLHIYGALRGRALAGVKGNEQAVICCQQFDAELVSIAGQYRLFDDDNEFKNHQVAVTLADERLNILSI